jgi:hypothetical protein
MTVFYKARKLDLYEGTVAPCSTGATAIVSRWRLREWMTNIAALCFAAEMTSFVNSLFENAAVVFAVQHANRF